MKFFLLWIILLSLSPLWGQAQEDSVQLIEEVRISAPIAVSPTSWQNSRLSARRIEAMQASDVGDVLRKMSSVNLRSYGGLGGLKTISFRSLGAQHSAIVLDGFTALNSQNGQINLGQIQTANLIGAQDMQTQGGPSLLPVSSMLSGGTFFLQSFENVFGGEGVSLRLQSSWASFDQLDEFLAARWRKNTWQISASGAFRKASGAYPYRMENGLQTLESVRTHNAYQDVNAAAMLGRTGRASTFRLGYKGKEILQELPGAVILYNENRDETLNTWEHTFFGDFEYRLGSDISTRVHAQANQQAMRYADPDYLNATGGINVRYTNRVLNGGLMLIWKPSNWCFQVGTEEFVSDLQVSDTNFSQPLRLHNMTVLSARWVKRRVGLFLQVSSQFVSERNVGATAENRARVNPVLRFTYFSRSRNFEHFVWYRSTFRMPSFNELYYNGIGNVKLLPEDAHLCNYGVQWRKKKKLIAVQLQSNLFFNWVKNKIVAIPTQNLFIWSMQNVGQTMIYGADAVLATEWYFADNWKAELNLNYTWQRALDYSDPSSPTWRHQLAYIPQHTGNADLELRFKETGLLLSNYFISMRYALNENIPANEVNGFWIMDASLYHTFTIKKDHRLTVRGGVKNILDQSYAYIRSYVMPGRNFQITLNYAFH